MMKMATTKAQRLAKALEIPDDGIRFPFFELPKELRFKVYRHALVAAPEPILIKGTGRTKAKLPALIKVWKQIRMEASPMYYSDNSFVFKVIPRFDKRSPLTTWMSRIGQSAQHLKTFRICFIESDSVYFELSILAQANPDAKTDDQCLGGVVSTEWPIAKRLKSDILFSSKLATFKDSFKK